MISGWLVTGGFWLVTRVFWLVSRVFWVITTVGGFWLVYRVFWAVTTESSCYGVLGHYYGALSSFKGVMGGY